MLTGPGMGPDSSGDVQNQMKRQPAALGFRVKSGWAAEVLLTGPARSPQLCDVRRIDLSDPRGMKIPTDQEQEISARKAFCPQRADAEQTGRSVLKLYSSLSCARW